MSCYSAQEPYYIDNNGLYQPLPLLQSSSITPQQLHGPPPPSTAPPVLASPTPHWDQAAFLQAMNHFATQGTSGMDWIFDSGASSHMSNSSTMLSNCTSSPFSSITLGNGSTIPIYSTGHTELPSTLKPLLLRDVLVAPALIKNLISVRKFTYDNLVSIEFDPFGLPVKDLQTKEEIARFNSSGDLYSINGAPTASPPSSMMATFHLWHQRLGHPNASTTSSLLSEFALPCNKDHHDPSMSVVSTRQTCAPSL